MQGFYRPERNSEGARLDAPKPAGGLPALPAGQQTPTDMVVIECAWCKRTMGTKPMVVPAGLEGHKTSGICVPCFREHFPAEYARKLAELKGKAAVARADALSFEYHVAGRMTYRSARVLRRLQHEENEARRELEKFEKE